MEKTKKISIIVPTYKEVGNIPALAERLYTAAAGRFGLEMIIVDDDSEVGRAVPDDLR